jgi:hypothetical protein
MFVGCNVVFKLGTWGLCSDLHAARVFIQGKNARDGNSRVPVCCAIVVVDNDDYQLVEHRCSTASRDFEHERGCVFKSHTPNSLAQASGDSSRCSVVCGVMAASRGSGWNQARAELEDAGAEVERGVVKGQPPLPVLDKKKPDPYQIDFGEDRDAIEGIVRSARRALGNMMTTVITMFSKPTVGGTLEYCAASRAGVLTNFSRKYHLKLRDSCACLFSISVHGGEDDLGCSTDPGASPEDARWEQNNEFIAVNKYIQSQGVATLARYFDVMNSIPITEAMAGSLLLGDSGACNHSQTKKVNVAASLDKDLDRRVEGIIGGRLSELDVADWIESVVGDVRNIVDNSHASRTNCDCVFYGKIKYILQISQKRKPAMFRIYSELRMTPFQGAFRSCWMLIDFNTTQIMSRVALAI